jgi:hypothetical protein
MNEITLTGNGLQHEEIPSREKEGPQPGKLRVFVQTRYIVCVDDGVMGPRPFGPMHRRAEDLPTYDFDHANPYTAELAAEILQGYVNEHILKLPASVKTKAVRVKADRR